MQQRGSGQIALMSSLAGYYGLPVTPSYCASKAAIKAYGEAIRGAVARYGVKVSVIMPGYVQSEMCAAMPGPKLFLWTADKAARVIAQRLQKNPARISFPFPLDFGTWLLAVMPASWSQYFVNLLGYGR
jgi:short-subunit dehydrogenase